MKDYTLQQQWFGNVRKDILAGILVALALIPEAIGFSIIAGVDPMVGLYASFCIAIIISIFGGRPGMISAATGSMAVVMVTLVADYGLQYLFAATILTGIIQFILGVSKIAKLMKFIPRSVMIGFVNALAILIFCAAAPVQRSFMGHVRHACRITGYHISIAEGYDGCAVSAGGDFCHDDHCGGLPCGCPHGR